MLNKNEKRVVVSGIGLITPLGIGLELNWEALCAGKSGIKTICSFATEQFRTRIAGEVLDFDPANFMDRKTARRTSRFIQFAIAASHLAVQDAGLQVDGELKEKTGTSIASAVGGIEILERNQQMVFEGNVDRVSPFFIPAFICNLAAGEVAISLGIRGPLYCSATACAAGTHAIGEAFRAIQRGEANAMLAGGSEAQIRPVILAGLDALRALSTRNSEPERASRPFEKNRDGFVLSEGAGILVLEELTHAEKRGARIYAEIKGYGNSCDAYHITTPDPDGTGAVLCIQRALEDAGLLPEEIEHINAHGTATVANDLTETRAIKKVFGERSKKIPVTASKSMLGHLWGAAGAVEAAVSVLTIHHGVIPPTINYDEPDPECDLDYVPNVARKSAVRTVISNSFGFGGTNGCLVFQSYP